MITIYKIYRIYLIPENNRVVYVGMTSKHPAVRLYSLMKDNSTFVECVTKYGNNCFGYDIIETVDTKEKAFEREAYWTLYYNSISPLFNIGLGQHSQYNKDKEEMREFYNKTLKPWLEKHGGPNKGKVMSEEQKLKIAMNNSRSKKVQCIETGIIYPSINNAHKNTEIPYANIKMACTFIDQQAGGYHWRFV